jgi:raffinose/stachyose/melibiose transport system substrate-binding protein
MRRIIFPVAFVVLCLATVGNAVASGQSEKSPAATNASGKQPAKHLTYLSPLGPANLVFQATQSVIQRYQKEVNPGFSVDIQSIPERPAYLQKLQTLIASNATPDLFNYDTTPYAGLLLKKGILMDLTPIVKDLQLDKVYYPAPLAWGKMSDGTQIGLPLDFSVEYFWYNKAMFADAGVAPPKTFTEFVQVLKTLKDKGDVPIAVAGRDGWPLLRYLDVITYRNGGNKFLTDLASGKQKMSGDIGMKAAQFVHDLGTSGYFQPDFASVDYTTALNYFISGKAAIIYNGTWELSNFVTNMKDTIGYFPVPTLDNGQPIGTSNFVADSTTPLCFGKKNFDDATKDFIKFMATNWAQALGGKSFSPTAGSPLPNIDSPLVQQVANDMAKAKGTIKIYDVELDPATNELISKLTVALALGGIAVNDFAAQVDASVAQNAPSFFSN